jgi:hypothetical protein
VSASLPANAGAVAKIVVSRATGHLVMAAREVDWISAVSRHRRAPIAAAQRRLIAPKFGSR